MCALRYALIRWLTTFHCIVFGFKYCFFSLFHIQKMLVFFFPMQFHSELSTTSSRNPPKLNANSWMALNWHFMISERKKHILFCKAMLKISQLLTTEAVAVLPKLVSTSENVHFRIQFYDSGKVWNSFV